MMQWSKPGRMLGQHMEWEKGAIVINSHKKGQTLKLVG